MYNAFHDNKQGVVMAAINGNEPLDYNQLQCPTCTLFFAGTNDNGVDLSPAFYEVSDAVQRHFHACCVPHNTTSIYTGDGPTEIQDHGEIPPSLIRLNQKITPVSQSLACFVEAVRAVVTPIFQAAETFDRDDFACDPSDCMNPVEIELEDYAMNAFLSGQTETLLPDDVDHQAYVAVRNEVNRLVGEHRNGRTTPYTWGDVRPEGNEQTLKLFRSNQGRSEGFLSDVLFALEEAWEAIKDAFTSFFRFIGLA